MTKFYVLNLLVLFTSCIQLVPCGWHSEYDIVDDNISKRIISGKYTLSNNSIEYLKQDFKDWPKNLELLSNGTYQFKNGRKIIKKGDWNFSCDDDYGCLLELEDITVEQMGRDNNDQLVVLITIGDPDSCDGIAYEKVK